MFLYLFIAFLLLISLVCCVQRVLASIRTPLLHLQICCSFGVDVLEALAASCTTLATAPQWTPRAALNVASDATVTFALLVTHGLALMAQALVFGVAMNSQKHTLLALLIAANFTEIKGGPICSCTCFACLEWMPFLQRKWHHLLHWHIC